MAWDTRRTSPRTGIKQTDDARCAVRLNNMKKFQSLVETVLKNGANRIGGFEF